MTIVDLFAGLGGWDLGARSIGLPDPLGIELNPDACATRRAAGLPTVEADIETLDPADFAPVEGLIASPPCQDFSAAGRRAGRAGDRGRLVDEVPRWVHALRPRWIACEQVPPVLPIWQEFALDFEALGYRTFSAVLNAADYGVPQTRRRAILLASLDPFSPPNPTHAKDPDGSLFPVDPWVTMADALGWTEPKLVGFPRRADGRGEATPDGYRARDLRTSTEPSLTITGKSRDVKVRSWPDTMPATTVAGDPRISARCHHDNGSQGANPRSTDEVRAGLYAGTEPIKLTLDEALVLQSFPPDYPVAGSMTSGFLQVGNAVPPTFAAAMLRAVAR